MQTGCNRVPRVPQVERSLVNHLTGAAFRLVPTGEIRADDEAIDRIVSICSEAAIYEWLFRRPFGGRPYGSDDARQWLRWAREGWSSGAYFVFAVVGSDGLVAAACDIKSDEPMPEIGYWCSQHHRGVMTNAVAAMCNLGRESGFRGFYARTKHGNVRSEAVLQRCGFLAAESAEVGYKRFELMY